MASSLPKLKLDRLLYTHYQHQNLEAAHKFFVDFGFHVVKKTDTLIYFRGFGENPFLYIAEKSPDDVKHFGGSGWLVGSQEDLEVAAQFPGASTIQNSDAPGGGSYVDVKDPNGIPIRLLHGVQLRSPEEQRDEIPKPVVMNSWIEKPRKGEFQRFDGGPSKVYKLGHFGVVVDKSKFDETVDWYLTHFCFARTDSLYDHESNRDVMTFMHIDKGEEFTDHHVRENSQTFGIDGVSDVLRKQSFFVQSPPAPVKESHAHHSSFEIDNMDSQLMGHYHLQSKGWTNCWGIGRHLLGSQIFDYW